MRKWLLSIVILGIIVVIINSLIWKNRQDTTSNFAVVDEMYDIISQESIYETSEKTLVDGALQGMTKAIKDPYSVYYTEEEAALFKQLLAEERIGIGVELALSDGQFVVIAPSKNSPAEQAGIQALDVIVQIDGEVLAGKTMAQVMQMIYGEEGKKIELIIHRPQVDQQIKMTMERARLQNETVTYDVLRKEDEVIGYISISSFAENTAQLWWKALTMLEKQGASGLIIDVRDNPGGYLHAVAQMMSTFNSSGKAFAYMQNEKGELSKLTTVKTEQLAPLQRYLFETPIAILQNGGSASASEMFAAALKSWGIATVIGTTSYGKGTVQETWDLQNKGELKLTTNRWLTPTQQSIHQKGIEPDIEVKQHTLYSQQLRAFSKSFKQGDLHEQIAYAQTILHELDYIISRQDGYFDEETGRAFRRFRERNHLSDGDLLDEELFNEIQQQLIQFKKNKEHDQQLNMAIQYVLHELQS